MMRKTRLSCLWGRMAPSTTSRHAPWPPEQPGPQPQRGRARALPKPPELTGSRHRQTACATALCLCPCHPPPCPCTALPARPRLLPGESTGPIACWALHALLHASSSCIGVAAHRPSEPCTLSQRLHRSMTGICSAGTSAGTSWFCHTSSDDCSISCSFFPIVVKIGRPCSHHEAVRSAP